MKHIHCNVFGHNYVVSNDVTNFVKEYKCKYCNSQLTTSGSGNLIPLTPKFKEINSVLKRIHLRKIKRRSFILGH